MTTYDARDPDTSYPPIKQLRPPNGAPNVLIVLIDDCGFGATSAFGGPIAGPTAERLAAGGLKYNRFHTTALCSPSRAALLNGRNHHDRDGGRHGDRDLGTGLQLNAPEHVRATGRDDEAERVLDCAVGKCHEVPVWETSPIGPFNGWPTGSGFEHFYGFIGGETNHYAPALYRDTVPNEQPKTAEEGYHTSPRT